jgi:predicted nuclease of predicted toxin-antitoxin system
MKILIDMNLSPDWVQTFAEAGIESVATMKTCYEQPTS